MTGMYLFAAAFVVTGIAMVIWPDMERNEPWYRFDGAEWSRLFLPHKDSYARFAGMLFMLAGLALIGLMVMYG